MAQIYRQTRSNAKLRCEHHKGSSISAEHYRVLVPTHLPAAIVVTLADTISAIGGTRCNDYTSLDATDKATIGLTKTENGQTTNCIQPATLANYLNANSYIVHEGYSAGDNKGKLVFSEGTTYHFPCSSPNQDDFENFQEMLEEQVAYQYLQSEGTTAQANAASAAYDVLKNALS